MAGNRVLPGLAVYRRGRDILHGYSTSGWYVASIFALRKPKQHVIQRLLSNLLPHSCIFRMCGVEKVVWLNSANRFPAIIANVKYSRMMACFDSSVRPLMIRATTTEYTNGLDLTMPDIWRSSGQHMFFLLQADRPLRRPLWWSQGAYEAAAS